MEEKERYEYFFGTNTIKDNKTNQFYGCVVDLLNQQDKRIKELEEDQALLTMLISGIDNLMHDKDYRFKNDNGTWYSRQSCKDLTNEEVYQEIIDEINQLDSNFEILDKENQQLKQQLDESETQLKEEIEEKNGVKRALSACNRQNDEFADMIKKLVNEKEELKQQLAITEKALELACKEITGSCEYCSYKTRIECPVEADCLNEKINYFKSKAKEILENE